jgi:glycosyltransferase involved in cell wall biosynthesis
MTAFSHRSGQNRTALLEPPDSARGASHENCALERSNRTGDRGKRRLLLVAYQFPPVGGAGVQRVTKFVKYLPRFDWQVTVLTVKNPSVPILDESLLRDIPAETVLARATTWEPDYSVKSLVAGRPNPSARTLRTIIRSSVKAAIRRIANGVLQPDPQVLWVPQAIRMGRELLGRQSHDAILASGPPFSTFLVGQALSEQSGVPLAVDYRDEWDLSNQYMENRKFGRLASWIQNRQQERVLRAASAVIATTRASTASLKLTIQRAGSLAEASCIYNGFDPDDFSPGVAESADRPGGAPFRLVYVGTLWRLTSMAPLGAALRLLADRVPDLGHRIKLVVAGRRTPEEQQVLASLQAATGCVEELAYVEHRDAVALMRSADLLLANLADLPGAERVLPAKAFEYLAVGKPILAVTPCGELWDLLKKRAGTALFNPSNAAGIAEFLESCSAGGSSSNPRRVQHVELDGLDRISQCRQLVDVLKRVVQSQRPGRKECHCG